MLNRRFNTISLSLIFLVVCGCISQKKDTSERSKKQPNIILIMADDMGYSDLGCYGSEIATPNLDKLASNGLRFRNFYNAARCCPTRASLLTGLYPHETGMGGMVSSLESESEPGPYQGYLNEQCVTIAEVLKSAGYSAYMSGKWHVGEKPQHWPRKRGFDKYFGLISGASSYFEIIKEQSRTRQMVLGDQRWEPPKNGFYMTDAFTDHAVNFIKVHHKKEKDKPYFLYLAYTAPHWPLHALPEDIKKYRGKYAQGWDSLRLMRYNKMIEIGIIDKTYQLSPRPGAIPAWDDVENKEDWERRMEVYAAMIDRMDQGIGKILNTLKDTKDWDNTLVLFLSDNGGCAESVEGRNLNDPSVPIGQAGSFVAYKEPWANASNTPFRKYKKWTHEGGISTPFIAHWPDVIKDKGQIRTETGHVIDIMATCLDIAHVEYPKEFNGQAIMTLRGKSLKPIFEGKVFGKERVLYWEHQGNKAVRKGKWKLVSEESKSTWELYNMEADPTELQDVNRQHPNIVKELSKLYKNWAEDVGVVLKGV